MLERLYTELRAADGAGRLLVGPAVVYGDVATIGGRFRERVEPRAFAPLPDDVRLTVQHVRGEIVARTGAGLVLTDTPDALLMRAQLPDTPRAVQAHADVRERLVRGLSVEMRVLADEFVGGVRVIKRAELRGLSLVDSGAYPSAVVEAREALLPGAPERRRWWL